MAIFTSEKKAAKATPNLQTAVTWQSQDSQETLSLEQPKELAERGFAYAFVIVFDILLGLLPVCFIVLASLSLWLHNRTKSSFGEVVIQAILLSPTVFGIMYAAIIGKFLRRLGVYKAERGVKLRTLERLIGSQSVYSAIERQIGLRKLDLLGFSLIALWSLSPLGGQASLRLLSTSPRIANINSSIQYYPIEGYQESQIAYAGAVVTLWPAYGSLYMSSLQLSRSHLNSSMDVWGGIKIPDISTSPSTTDGEWYSFDHQTETSYVSLLGVPFFGIPQSGNTTFNMTSHYWSVDCGEFHNGTKDWNETTTGGIKDSPFKSFRMETQPVVNISDIQEPMNFTYTSLRESFSPHESSPSEVAITECSARLTFVDSRVDCTGKDCRVGAMRYTSRTKDPFGQSPSSLFHMITSVLPGTDVGMHMLRRDRISRCELTESWIMNPETTFSTSSGSESTQFANFDSLPTAVFSKRLQMVMNTFWDGSTGPEFRNEKLKLDENHFVCDHCIPEIHFNTTKLSGDKFDGEIYVCNKVFAIITIIVAWVLFVSAVISLILATWLTTAPDILGFISTYLRDNPHAKTYVPSNLDGMDAARILGDEYIIIGDVQPEENIGHVAIASVGLGVKRLDRKKLYD